MGSHEREVYWVFQGLSAQVDPGQALILVSRDPVRTSAALRVMAGMLPVDKGSVQRPGRSLLLVSPQGRWLRELSVEQTIRLLAGTYGLYDDEIEQMLVPVARLAAVESMLHLPLEDLSRRYASQIAFAIAMHAPVPLVMFDHTATVGTSEFRHACADRLVELRDAGKALIIATDKPKVALQIGTDAVILRGKRSDPASVVDAAEFLLRGAGKTRKRPQRSQEDDDDEGLDF